MEIKEEKGFRHCASERIQCKYAITTTAVVTEYFC